MEEEDDGARSWQFGIEGKNERKTVIEKNEMEFYYAHLKSAIKIRLLLFFVFFVCCCCWQ